VQGTLFSATVYRRCLCDSGLAGNMLCTQTTLTHCDEQLDGKVGDVCAGYRLQVMAADCEPADADVSTGFTGCSVNTGCRLWRLSLYQQVLMWAQVLQDVGSTQVAGCGG